MVSNVTLVIINAIISNIVIGTLTVKSQDAARTFQNRDLQRLYFRYILLSP